MLVRRLVAEANLSTQMNILDTFSSLKLTGPASQVLDLLESTTSDPLRVGILRYFISIPFEALSPALRERALSVFEALCDTTHSSLVRSTAIKVLISQGTTRRMVLFIQKALGDADFRVVANAIEGLNGVIWPAAGEMISPFLGSKVPRIKANSIVTLWESLEHHKRASQALEEMLDSASANEVASGLFALGEVRSSSQFSRAHLLSGATDPMIQRGALIALLKLGHREYQRDVVDMILGRDEEQAINTCYLSLKLEKRVLHEQIIASVQKLGNTAVQTAIWRFASCGAFCGEQIELLNSPHVVRL